ncbi:1-acyl-sn-glycerol-3-phosphate acyltransferase [Bacteroidota bacterium]
MNDIELEPYSDQEVPAIMKRIVADKNFPVLIPYAFPDREVSEIADILLSCSTTREFQERFMASMVRSFVQRTSTAYTTSGAENLDPDKSYLYIGNHRDIILDSGMLQVLLLETNLETSEMSIGKNLMVNELICDLGKANKMIPVERTGSARDLLKSSAVLSRYIRRSVTEKGISVWIAQRNGRAKDGFDKTESALLKMLNMSGSGSFIENFEDLNIVPISTSYEIEPCDVFKVQEIYETSKGQYVKKPGEDVKSMATGLIQPKGRIHLSVSDIINDKLANLGHKKSLNENFNELSAIIDKEIYKNYKLWPSNYIAYDMLYKERFKDQYSSEEKSAFMDYYFESMNKLKGENEKLSHYFLKMYANPVINRIDSDLI